MCTAALQNYYIYSNTRLVAQLAVWLLALLNIPATAANSNKV